MFTDRRERPPPYRDMEELRPTEKKRVDGSRKPNRFFKTLFGRVDRVK